ncbi:uncharacterized protein CLUP02_00523 [Colletotrichum lupini]|uniref:Uncharacterized protein n=1 Tax=Colletotrichum lupini TaxID=145971 RepID=A0A9Q8SAI3_9PEZI|nr:uncharacterized protein CLUP02_00523 [Colletotrichum lupini]UQC73876.1 hypothetical protein CLUP02_00523 [Colletotrichum lupini]
MAESRRDGGYAGSMLQCPANLRAGVTLPIGAPEGRSGDTGGVFSKDPWARVGCAYQPLARYSGEMQVEAVPSPRRLGSSLLNHAAILRTSTGYRVCPSSLYDLLDVYPRLSYGAIPETNAWFLDLTPQTRLPRLRPSAAH